MAKNNNVKDFTKDIADAIRAKENSVAKINPQDFSARIAALSVGGSPKFTELVGASLTTIEASDLRDVTTIRQACFLELLSLVSVTIPDNIKTIEGMAFLLCSNLQHLDLGNGVETIGDSAFAGINAKDILLPNTLTRVGLGAFSSNNALESITIPDSLNNLPDELFTSCDNLREVIMVSKNPPSVGYATFPSTTTIYVPYGAYDDYVAQWSAYASQIARLPAIPSTLTVIVNNYLGELVSGTEVTISGNGQTYTGMTDSVGTFTQGDLQPATYTVSVADMEGFKTPEVSEVVVEEDTQNSVTVTYLEKSSFTQVDPILNNNSIDKIASVADEIALNNMTSAQVESTYGWKLGDTLSYSLSTGEPVTMRIIGFNHDDKSDGSGKAGITLEMTNVLKNNAMFNETGTNAGGYYASTLRNNYLPDIIMPMIPQEFVRNVVAVNKKSANGGGSNYSNIVTSSEKLFVLSLIEKAGTTDLAQSGENEGVQYEYWVGKTESDFAVSYPAYTRSCYINSTTNVPVFWTEGYLSSRNVDNAAGIIFAVCLGKGSQQGPEDGHVNLFGKATVDEIQTTANAIAKNNMTSTQVAETYGWYIGDTTTIQLTTGENIKVRIAGFNHDPLSDGSGKAGITLEMANVLKDGVAHANSATNYGGYSSSLVKSSLNNVLNTMPLEWSNIIKQVKKDCVYNNATTKLDVKLFLLSEREITGSGASEGSLYEYYSKYPLLMYRCKPKTNSYSNSLWWTRSVATNNAIDWRCVTSSGSMYQYGGNSKYGVSFAFCV